MSKQRDEHAMRPGSPAAPPDLPVDMIRRRLQTLLRVVQLESGGVPVEIDGFRIKARKGAPCGK